jgi:hypothetical protein
MLLRRLPGIRDVLFIGQADDYALGEVPKSATVTVNSDISVTVVDYGTTDLSFGNLDPGAVKQEEANSPSLTITAPIENNGPVAVSLKGADFSGIGHTITIDNAFWNTSNNPDTATSMTTDFASVTTINAGESVNFYHWLSILSGQAADTYTSTFTYKTE